MEDWRGDLLKIGIIPDDMPDQTNFVLFNLDELNDFIKDMVEKAREEGYKKGREDQQHLDGLLYGTTVATTTTLEEGWILKDKKKVEEELSKLTTK